MFRVHLTPAQQSPLKQVCEQFPSVLTAELGLTNDLEYKIRLTDSNVVRSHPNIFAPPKTTILREKVQDLLDQDVIEP